ncbi:MAG: PQQ-binding-like beta-propeller repeat protein [Vicinamibacterales bacterium]|nr:PQQ-binding-like beta-propeller repeat protein [Vicinamibacterales bacterium]
MRVLDTRRVSVVITAIAVVAFCGIHPVSAEAQGRTTRTGEPPAITAGSSQANWASHNLDPYNQRFAMLDQINTTTVGQLQRRWSFDVPAGLSVGQVTPLVVDGLMYVHSGATVLAINAVTGDEVWRLEVDGVSGGVVRGPLYADGTIYSYHGDKLVAADAKTGALVESFGDGGVLPVFGLALEQKYPDVYPPGFDASSLNYRMNSSPAYYDNTLYAASAISEGNIPGGLVVAADADTGAIKWVFNTIPQGPQDEGWELADPTWGDGKRVGAGIWTQPAIDVELGLLFFNTANPNPPYDGSARPGANLFTNSTIALDLETGALRWHYQTIHHDLWDWDNITGPVLFDVTRNGETIKGIGAAGKNCLLYLWHRETGEPINPMVETLVPTETNVPGEVVYPTQPIPHNAAGVPLTPFCATYLDLDDPELQAQARQMYTPYSTDEHYIVAHGGSSFGSPSFSPRTGLLYVTGKNAGVSLLVKPLGDSLKLGEGGGHAKNFTEIDRIPAFPPSMTLTAYEPASGRDVWQQVLPAITFGASSGSVATAGDLIFQGTEDGGFYAFHSGTGEQLFHYDAGRTIRSSPLTYEVNGTQYVAVIASNTVLAFTLP